MELAALDDDLLELIRAKMRLGALDYADEAYDEAEEALHDLEDAFMTNYGSYLEDALHEVHDEMCPDSDVLLPIAYIPNRVVKGEDGIDAPISEGVFVDVDDYSDPNTKLVLLPRPTRIILLIGPTKRETLWTAS